MSEINFLPQSYMNRMIRKRRIVREIVGVAVLALALIGFWANGQQQVSHAKAEAVQLQRDLDQAKVRESQFASLENEMKQLRMQIRLEKELTQPIKSTQILAKLSEVLPGSVAVLEMDLAAKRVKPKTKQAIEKDKTASRSRRGQAASEKAQKKSEYITVVLVGMAPDDIAVAEVIELLDESLLFNEIEMRYSRVMEHEGLQGRQFKIAMKVDLGCEYIQMDKGRVADAH